MKIYKYALPSSRGEYKLIAYPIEEIKHIAVVGDQAFFWALVNDSRREIEHVIHALHTGEEDRHFNVIGTEFLGTALFHFGSYVLHYYIDEL